MTAFTIVRTMQAGATDGTMRRIIVEQRRGHISLSRREATITLLAMDSPPPRTNDAALLGVLQHLMRIGSPVHVEGTLTPRLIRNVAELQTYWSRWRRGRLHPVPVAADVLAAPPAPPPQEALALFSGGVDATFTLLRHTASTTPHLAEPLTAGLMVHGFDVPLARGERFDRLVARVTPLLAERGVPLLRIRTDLRSALDQDWEDSHGLQLACMLHQFADRFGIGLIGSGEPIDIATLPWGSTMATDHLMSSDDMAMRHDGGGFTRTQKLALIAQHPTALSTLKVCYSGPDEEQNCGVCEKCVRTRLAMMAAGVTEATCFPDPLLPRHIARLRLRPDTADKFDEILREAERNGLDASWMARLRRKLFLFRRFEHPGRFVVGPVRHLRDRLALRTRISRYLSRGATRAA